MNDSHSIAEFVNRVKATLPPGTVVDDRDLIAPWLSDWRGRYHGASVAILSPSTTGEVQAILHLATEYGVPLVPQGGNTSMVGGATPPADGSAVILSLRRMNRLRSMDRASGLAVAEAGMVLENLHHAARDIGMRFPLSLGAKGSATVGGLISTNAGGTQVLRYGTMRALVAGVEAVLPDGTLFDGLSPLKKDNRGYDLKQLLIGAEGTLGVITAATLRLVPMAAERAVAWIGLDSPHMALALLRSLEAEMGSTIEGFEVIPGDGLSHAMTYLPDARAPLSGLHPWHVLIEAMGDAGTSEVLESALAKAMEAGLFDDAVLAKSDAEADAFWLIRESLSPAEKAQGPAVQFDISVPVDAMPDFMVDTARTMENRFAGHTASSFGHLGDGNVHFHVRMPKGEDEGAWRAEQAPIITRAVNDMVVAAGGSISAEHGIGQMKLAEFERLTDPGRIAALRAIKYGLDPQGLMNPGKLVP